MFGGSFEGESKCRRVYGRFFQNLQVAKISGEQLLLNCGIYLCALVDEGGIAAESEVQILGRKRPEEGSLFGSCNYAFVVLR